MNNACRVIVINSQGDCDWSVNAHSKAPSLYVMLNPLTFIFVSQRHALHSHVWMALFQVKLNTELSHFYTI